MTASTGPFTEHGAVYGRPLDATGPFERCHAGLPDWFEDNIDTFQIAAGDEAPRRSATFRRSRASYLSDAKARRGLSRRRRHLTAVQLRRRCR